MDKTLTINGKEILYLPNKPSNDNKNKKISKDVKVTQVRLIVMVSGKFNIKDMPSIMKQTNSILNKGDDEETFILRIMEDEDQ